jgi:selenide, water dikinase
MFDLLSLVEAGGCSAKLSATDLAEALKDLPKMNDENLLVDIDTHDDAGVYKVSDEIALIQTTDFFPPICSDAYDYGQIAAANALSDVYAMGGKPITALNLLLFPSKNISMQVLKEILRGGQEKVAESGALVVGGHTVVDDIPKYGLAVTGIVHPEKVITNANAEQGDVLVLTKAIGTGVIISGKKGNEVTDKVYSEAIETMKRLNSASATVMQEFNVRAATDVTGFGLLGHAMKMAEASDVSIEINSNAVPIIEGAYDLVDKGYIPCASFSNQEYLKEVVSFSKGLDYNLKMLLLDAQTSGGMLICVSQNQADALVGRLREEGDVVSTVVGRVKEFSGKRIIVS